MTETTLVDCMSDHEVEEGGRVVSCPYKEIAEKLLAALKEVKEEAEDSMNETGEDARGSLKYICHVVTPAITQATVFPQRAAEVK